ncbi:MAG: L-serine ammonia-lyase [Corallococcus sp.]|nr:L-serine ammonia-lyase [Corallococcus sp.]
MKSITELYKTGIGPSSSHTMGPVKAALQFADEHPDADCFEVQLYGSLALTGKGHGTDRALSRAFAPKKSDIVFDVKTKCRHPNSMDFTAYSGGKKIGFARVISIGGGDVVFEGRKAKQTDDVYHLRTFKQIKDYCEKTGIKLWQYAAQCEGEQITDYLRKVWRKMLQAVEQGLAAEGTLEGGLKVLRRAKKLLRALPDEDAQTRENRLVAAYAFAVSEQNADGGEVVTAPTCGSCGVLPAVFKYVSETKNLDEETVLHGLLTAGIVGNLVKHNASISGAECGCQAEIGTACAMAAAGLAEMYGMTIEEIEYSAEVALEHHLGLTCDPIGGLVQIPCIERNAVAAMRAINAVNLATFLADSGKISLDTVIETMYETGKDIAAGYRETALSGLAKHYEA